MRDTWAFGTAGLLARPSACCKDKRRAWRVRSHRAARWRSNASCRRLWVKEAALADACRWLRFPPRSLGLAAEPSVASLLVISVASVSPSAAGPSQAAAPSAGEVISGAAGRGGVGCGAGVGVGAADRSVMASLNAW